MASQTGFGGGPYQIYTYIYIYVYIYMYNLFKKKNVYPVFCGFLRGATPFLSLGYQCQRLLCWVCKVFGSRSMGCQTRHCDRQRRVLETSLNASDVKGHDQHEATHWGDVLSDP